MIISKSRWGLPEILSEARIYGILSYFHLNGSGWILPEFKDFWLHSTPSTIAEWSKNVNGADFSDCYWASATYYLSLGILLNIAEPQFPYM